MGKIKKSVGAVLMGMLVTVVAVTGVCPVAALDSWRPEGWPDDQTFTVIAITPAQNDMRMIYRDLSGTGRRPTNVNLVWEKVPGVGRDRLPELAGAGRPAWAETLMNISYHGETAYFVDGWPQQFAGEAFEYPLREIPGGVFYYYMEIEHRSDWSVYGKVDFSSCLNSPYMREDAECQLEVAADGTKSYWPYLDNKRLGPSENAGAMGGVEGQEAVSGEQSVQLQMLRQKAEPSTERAQVVALQVRPEADSMVVRRDRAVEATHKEGEERSAGQKKQVRVPELGEVRQADYRWLWLVLAGLTVGLGLYLGLWWRRRRER